MAEFASDKSPRADSGPPRDFQGLADWLAGGVRAEIAELEKQEESRSYEVLSGTLVEHRSELDGVFRFLLADSTRLLEDAFGRLKVGVVEYSATIQQAVGDTLLILVSGPPVLPTSIPRGMLVIDDTALLRKMADTLDVVSTGARGIPPLAVAVFHPPRDVDPPQSLPGYPWLSTLDSNEIAVIERACGCPITYVWGPPGTGKTYVIARIVASLVALGERVMLTSHTHAAVDQAIYELVRSDPDRPGPLSNHAGLIDGKFIRLGRTDDKKIPDAVRFDSVVTTKAQNLGYQIQLLEDQARPHREKQRLVKDQASEWDRLTALVRTVEEIRAESNSAIHAVEEAEANIMSARSLLHLQGESLEEARRSWLFRNTRIARAERARTEAQGALSRAESARQTAAESLQSLEQQVNQLRGGLVQQQARCRELPPYEELACSNDELGRILGPIEETLRKFYEERDQIPGKVLAEAQAVFCTLTKNYTAEILKDHTFDAVIIDELSMALPPLVFLALVRSTRRIILVGDFCQLPPVVRSDSELSDDRMRTDLFRMSGLVGKDGISPDANVLVPLDGQRRMVPAIADIARKLMYDRFGGLRDNPEATNQSNPDWMNHLPENPLLIADTADLNCWCGKQPGSLSRFNFYSARVAVEIADSLARRQSVPEDSTRKPIGIITPYAAQRRHIQKLVDELGLRPWIAAGTVHTFQGQEAEVIIFDSVLDEPYWAARLCTPNDSADVLRDLNVAVTRTKKKFVFLGSSEWLNKYAKVPSGLGMLWAHLKDHADLVPASDFSDHGDSQQALDLSSVHGASSVPVDREGPKMQLLDENSFFDCFARDMEQAVSSIFAFAAYFGEYRWPRVEPLFRQALSRGVEVTIVTPPPDDTHNPSYVRKVIKNLRAIGARVVAATGMHGKDIIIDGSVVYTGSLNWASSRGRPEIVHRINSPEYAKLCLEMAQAKHIRTATVNPDGLARVCPHCGHEIQIVNVRRQPRWDFNPLKIGCSNPNCPQGYLVPIDARAPFVAPPLCEVDHKTLYRRVRRGRGESWQCPKHPKQCTSYKVVAGDCH